jgi:aspartyl protease family protein
MRCRRAGNAAYLLYLIGLVVLVVVISSVTRLRGIGALALAMIVAVIGYAYRFELQGVVQHAVGALLPYRGEQIGKGSVNFAAWPAGQFRIEATVNGTPVLFLVETGASEVVLTPRDAERLGYDPRDFDFSNSYTTANGGRHGGRRSFFRNSRSGQSGSMTLLRRSMAHRCQTRCWG